jgi:hypothetical protein
VPVYLGDENITDLLPAEAFVNVRGFLSLRHLLEHLARMPEAEWTRRRHVGQAWLRSSAAQSFSAETFARTATQVLRELSPPRASA